MQVVAGDFEGLLAVNVLDEGMTDDEDGTTTTHQRFSKIVKPFGSEPKISNQWKTQTEVVGIFLESRSHSFFHKMSFVAVMVDECVVRDVWLVSVVQSKVAKSCENVTPSEISQST